MAEQGSGIFGRLSGPGVRAWAGVFLFWLVLVILWNFGYPAATPGEDVLAAVGFSVLSTLTLKKISG